MNHGFTQVLLSSEDDNLELISLFVFTGPGLSFGNPGPEVVQ